MKRITTLFGAALMVDKGVPSMQLRRAVLAAAFAINLAPAQAQLTSGYGTGPNTYSSEDRACSAAKDQASSMADAQVRWHRRNKGVNLSPTFTGVTPRGECKDCKEYRIYGNPSEFRCSVGWQIQ